jgi:5-methylcytosine-specific restriction endonuclease McrA
MSSKKGTISVCSGYVVSRAKIRSKSLSTKTAIQKTRQMLRGQITRMLEMMRADRQCKTEQYVGCSFEEARHAIESKFELGMSWDNYGTDWELDHIVPMSSFDLSKPDQAMRVNHISNLQPMHPSFNRSKGNKIYKKNKKSFQNLGTLRYKAKPAGNETQSLLL